jgi:hypothetical protein
VRGVGQRVGKAAGVDPGPKALRRLSVAGARWSCGTTAAQEALRSGARWAALGFDAEGLVAR